MQAKKKFIITYYKKRIDTFLTHIKKTKTLCREDTIHKLRVEIKKLRALFILIEKLESKNLPSNKPYKLFKPLFKEAGIIREAQLNLKLILNYHLAAENLLPYIDFLEHQQIQSEIALKKLVKKFDLGKLHPVHSFIKRIAKKFNNQTLSSHICFVLTNEIKEIEKNQKRNITNEKMHSIRKHIKRIDTLLDMFSKIKPIPSLTQFLVYSKSLQKTIGEWHDKLVLSESINEFLKSQQTGQADLKKVQMKVAKESKKILRKLQKEILRTSNEMKQQLNPILLLLEV